MKLLGRMIYGRGFLLFPFVALSAFASGHFPDGQTARRAAIVLTRATVEIPVGFTIPENAPAVISMDGRMTLTIIEAAMPRDLTAINYANPDTLEKNGFTMLRKPDSISVDGNPGYRFYLQKNYGLLRSEGIISQVSIVGDSLGALTMIASYPDTTGPAAIEELTSIVTTIRWDRRRPLNPMTLLNFSLDIDSSLTEFGVGPDWMLLFRGAAIDTATGRGFLMMKTFPNPGGLIREENHERLMESLLENADPELHVSSVLEYNKLTLDGVGALETVSSGRLAGSDATIAVYEALILHPLGFITFIGTSDTLNGEDCIASYRKTVRSFRRTSSIALPPPSCDSLLQSGRTAEAETCFREELSRDPRSVAARLGLADALRRAGKLNDALRLYDEVVAVDAGNRDAYIGRARTHTALQSYTSAGEDYERAAAFDTRDVSVLVEKSNAERKSGSILEARRDLSRAIALRPDSAGLRVMMSEFLPHAEAMKLLDTALLMDEINGFGYEQRGVRNLLARRYQNAIRDFSSAVSNGCATSFVYASRGSAYLDLGKLDNAISDFDRAIGLNKRDTMAQEMRAFSLGLKGKFGPSEAGFRTALSLDSTALITSLCYGVILFLEGKYKEAAVQFRNAAGRSTDGEVRAWLFFAEFKLHGPDIAQKNLKSYHKYISTRPNEQWFDIVRYLVKEIDEETLLQRARSTEIDPADAYRDPRKESLCDSYFAIGMGHHIAGRKIGAKAYWKKCLETGYSSLVSYQVAEAITRGLLTD